MISARKKLKQAVYETAFKEVASAARDASVVSGLTHNFYRYPARFSPKFVRAAIQTFSKPGDWIIDPFAGGGTTLVEALVAGRNVLGVDISELAIFVCKAKTLHISDSDAEAVKIWVRYLPERLNMRLPSQYFNEYASAGYYRNIEGKRYWRLRKAIEQALVSITDLPNKRTQTFARCVILRTAQWALDSRKVLPSISSFRSEIVGRTFLMLSGALDLRANVPRNPSRRRPKTICLNRPAAGLEFEPIVKKIPPPALIMTSPPYPGVHVLYHRWQVDGRKETPAPFWIANQHDGAGLSHYALGDRKHPQLRTYFENLKASFESIANICGPKTAIVQMLAFAEPAWQLPHYLEIMKSCGLSEIRSWSKSNDSDGRLWRTIPRRKWYVQKNKDTRKPREVVLIHTKSI